MRRVAALSGCSTIGVYTHFGSKSALVDAAIMEAFAGLDQALAPIDELHGVDRLLRGAHAYRDWALAHPLEYTVMFAPSITANDASDASAERGGLSLDDHVARTQDAVDRGELTGDTETIARSIWSQVHGWVMTEILQADPGRVGADGRSPRGVRRGGTRGARGLRRHDQRRPRADGGRAPSRRRRARRRPTSTSTATPGPGSPPPPRCRSPTPTSSASPASGTRSTWPRSTPSTARSPGCSTCTSRRPAACTPRRARSCARTSAGPRSSSASPAPSPSASRPPRASCASCSPGGPRRRGSS